MRRTGRAGIAGAVLAGWLCLGGAWAQDQPARPSDTPALAAPPAPGKEEAGDPSLSPECRVPGSQLYTLAKLRAVKAALSEKRPVRVLAIGGTAAPGASATYPVKLETAIESALPDVDVLMEYRGLQGEIASGAAERLRSMVADLEPDLVVWQVGTHDALARVDLDAFAGALGETVTWIKSHAIDVVLVDPLYTASLADDAYYTSIVRAVRTVAAREKVPLVLRYDAMRYLAGHSDKGESHMLGQQFRLNDLGLRCMAEHVARAITLSLLQPDVTGTAGPPVPPASPPGQAASPAGPPTAPGEP
ncbi:SGNH/GDSL hydrolase family protein [uncultured Methylobacterium sp.]|uniref:SGNH/GDSL hydrolase family protein n=1 Tax=uncultured Methylobacterium sp. TaxID=157278 RepID=UPI0035CB3F61